MKKLSKKIYAFLLTAIMVLSMIPMTAFADEGKQSITINGVEEGNKDIAGRTFNVYRVFEANYNEATDEATGVFVDYEVADDFKEFFKQLSDTLELQKGETFDAVDYMAKLENDGAAVKTVAMKLAHYVRDKEIDTAGVITPGESGNNTLEGLPYGYYFIDEPAAVEGNAAMLGALQKGLNAKFTVKSERPTITKKIEEGSEQKDVTDAQIGDTVTFTLTSKIPEQAASYESDYWFEFHDVLSDGLTFDGDDKLSVTVGNKSLDQDKDYTVTENKDDHTFTVKIDSETAKANAGQEVIVTYTATLNENAVTGGSGNSNEATVEYSNNPYWTGEPNEKPDTETTEPDTNVVFTLLGNGTKIDAADETKLLGGAEFELYTDEKMESESRIYVKKADDNGGYVITKDETDVEADVKITSTEGTGAFSIKGLKAGTYFLKETKAPHGYNQLKTPIKLTVTAVYDENGDGKMVVTKLEVTTENSPVNIAEIKKPENGSFDYAVKNTAGATLPETGGIGTYLFTFGGLILMIAAVALLIYSKKKTAHK